MLRTGHLFSVTRPSAYLSVAGLCRPIRAEAGCIVKGLQTKRDAICCWSSFSNSCTDVRGNLRSRSRLQATDTQITNAKLGAQDMTLLNVAPQQQSRVPAARDVSALRGRFQIPAAEVRRILRDQQLTLEELLLKLIQPASLLARPYISGFKVGFTADQTTPWSRMAWFRSPYLLSRALGVGGSGAIYVGVNIEFPNAALNNSIHAEQCLLVNCLHHKETELRTVAVSEAPCGHCRQFYTELVNADAVRFMFGKDPRLRSLEELLPLRFGPADLAGGGVPPFPLLMEQQRNAVSFRKSTEVAIASRSDDGLFQEAAGEALTEAIQSYSPYTRCPSGVAIIMSNGQIHSGSYIESVAFNPSLSPFHAAIVAGIADQDFEYYQIREVILAELPGAAVQHAQGIYLLLRAIAPKAALVVLHLQPAAASSEHTVRVPANGRASYAGLDTPQGQQLHLQQQSQQERDKLADQRG